MKVTYNGNEYEILKSNVWPSFDVDIELDIEGIWQYLLYREHEPTQWVLATDCEK